MTVVFFARQVWTMSCVSDWLESGKIDVRDVTAKSLKTSGKSITDVSLTTWQMKIHFLGAWLDSKHLLSSSVKEQLRLIFQSHANYRSMWNPNDAKTDIDTNWSFGWSKAALAILAFIEKALYQHGPHEESLMRQVVSIFVWVCVRGGWVGSVAVVS